MSARALLAAALLAAVVGCGDGGTREVRLLAPVGIVKDDAAATFERDTGCRVDLRVYDPDEDIDAIARRRDTDVVARPTRNGETPDVSEALVEARLKGGVTVTVPARLARSLEPLVIRPAGRRELTWAVRDEGDNDACARRWLNYATPHPPA